MEIIPKAGKVMVKFLKEEEGTIVTPEAVKKKNRKRRRWGEVILAPAPLPEEKEFKAGEIICFSTAGIKMNDDDTAIVDTDKILLYENR
jgi:co-chaperonin GroES (HSP10)